MNRLDGFSKVKVLVVGDVMIDRYWWGNVERISPEAPVPVVQLQRKTIAAGGAANVAANIAGLGAEAFLIGAIGDDEESKLLPEALGKINVSAEHLLKLPDRPTTVKTRIIAHHQQVVRLDQEVNSELTAEEEKIIWEKTSDLIEKTDIVVISDYAKGLLTESLLTRLISFSKAQNQMILVDPKGKDYTKYKGASLLTPNRKEALEACNFSDNGQNIVEKAGKKLLNELELGAILVTQGEHGMTLFRNDSKPFHLDAVARDVYDVTGAGDTVIASLAVALGAGSGLEEAAEISNIAAGLVVEQVGTTPIKIEELKAVL
jgi:D-beta-D-heptose 7-phosphate kinase/D-beta-D-heptose 1-phosphate adenosyltransferase